MISYFKTKEGKALNMRWDVFQKLLDDPQISRNIEACRAAATKDEASQFKGKLPAITWQAHVPEGKGHQAKFCEPNGFIMMDYDNVENPTDLWKSFSEIINKRKNWLKELLVAHITPSGHGLRLVFVNLEGCPTIADNQRKWGEILGNTNYDDKCKDFSRISFVCRRADILFINYDLFISQPPILLQNEKLESNPQANNAEPSSLFPVNESTTQLSDGSSSNSADDHSGTGGESVQKLMYNDTISYEEIVKELVQNLGGEPKEGSRNTFLYRLARILRYIVDFDAFKLAKVLPTFGLPASEVATVANSAVKSNRSEKIPYALYSILQRFERGEKAIEEEETVEEATDIKLPPLPPIFKQFVRISPDDFKVPTIFALLPVMGTLMSKLRAVYLDGERHAPNFTTVIEAPQASGKSFTRRIVKTCMKQIEYMDNVSRIAEQQYMLQLKKSKNSKNQPEEPTAIVRFVPASISIARLLKRLNNAKTLHLFTFLEEMDTLTKSNKAGVWSQKTDIYRLAFDNADYGQDYMSENSYSGIFPVYYNLLACGTPKAVGRFYNDAEDGLVSRVIFCQLPSQFGAKMPVFKKLSSFEEKLIDNLCTRCDSELCCSFEQEVVPEQTINLDYLNKAIDKWLEKQRLESIEEVSLARNIFYRRAGVIGFRAGMIAAKLWDMKQKKVENKEVIAFSLFVCNYVLETLIKKFGREVEDSGIHKQTYIQPNLWKNLDAEFSRNDVIAERKKCEVSTPVKIIIHRWKKAGMIEEVSKFNYKKIEK